MVDRDVVAEEYRAVRSRAGGFALDRDFVRAAGPDATKFLQGQLSQDLNGVAKGSSVWALLLAPQGKLDAFLRVLRTGDGAGGDEWVLETDAGWGPAVIERLNRFKLRVKCDLEPLEWSCVAVRGPAAKILAPQGRGTSVGADWPGLLGVDLIGPDVAPPVGLAMCSPDTWTTLRIESGIPAMGSELDERTIPAEAGIVDRSVSFTKGCYTGQELVARIDSRGGNVPRHLRAVVVEGDVDPPAGARVEAEGKQVGHLTTVGWSPLRGIVALAYVGRAVTPPAAVEVVWDGGRVAARAEPLPLTA